ncbi:MAG: HAD family hydrolase [Gammaproteobacteria bacterium]
MPTKKISNTNVPNAIFVDLDGVLRHWPTTDSTVELNYNLPLDSIQKIAFEPTLLNLAIRGIITDDDWRSQIVNKLLAEHPTSKAELAITEWSDSPGVIDTKLLNLLSICNSKNGISLVTNATSRLDKDLEALGLIKRFRAVVNSSDVGFIKPEPEIFQYAIQTCTCPANEILFIDDSIENVEAASNAGMMSHRYTGFAECKDYLSKVGMLCGA